MGQKSSLEGRGGTKVKRTTAKAADLERAKKALGGDRGVPKALLRQKQQFLDALSLQQKRSAKETIKRNKERLNQTQSLSSGLLNKISSSRLL